ncbi:bifunctional 3'-5' exonuclease/DNA polymerase [Jannaschia sp. R86511]|uniref:bifunctional 3'-5' exonuclease/DNA polymerase n=1 Tax=Jannaschia sp. R86511 TaxID=3093853 RepID=UPI0036D39FB5
MTDGQGTTTGVRQVLLRRVDDVVEAVELRGPEVVGTTALPADDLPAFVRTHEADRPRWTWDDTARWYPELLQAGVRVERCADLRLQHDVLRRSPLCRLGPADEDAAAWDRLEPVTASVGALFDGHEVAGLDALAEHVRQQHALTGSEHRARLGLLLTAESSGALVAAELTHAGLPWRADVHRQVLEQLLGPRPATGRRPATLERLLQQLRGAFDAPALNPDSPGSLLPALRAAGLEVPDTRSWTLERLDHPGVPVLLEYKKLARLLSTNGWHWLDTWVEAGRFRPEYVPGGVVTGRWASRGGGALTIPAPLRPAVVADDGWRLVVADAAQLEPRVLAGLSHDLAMADAGRGTDLYEGMVRSGAVATRSEAKLGMLGAMYGGTRGESGRMIARMTRAYPAAVGCVEDAARAGERGEVVRTLLGRGSPVPAGSWTQDTEDRPRDVDAETRDRRAWGRFTRNFVVQGTAAEWALAWLARLRNRLWLLGEGPLTDRPHLVLFLHDEVVVHCPGHLVADVEAAVTDAAAEAGRLLFGDFPVDFPLEVSVVGSWAQAR